MKPTTSRTSQRLCIVSVVCALWLASCASGMVDEEDALLGDASSPSLDLDAAAPDADAYAPLPPWLANPTFDSGATSAVPMAADASSPTGVETSTAQVDAARPRPTRDAGSSTRPTSSDAGASSTRCSGNASSCTNECALSGPLRCCTTSGGCGCTWAPGAYCL